MSNWHILCEMPLFILCVQAVTNFSKMRIQTASYPTIE